MAAASSKGLWRETAAPRGAGVPARGTSGPSSSRPSAALRAGGVGATGKGRASRRVRVRSAAVALMVSGEGLSIAEAIIRARERKELDPLGINSIRPKRSVTGGLLLEIPGAASGIAADRLYEKMSEVFRDEDRVTVTRPRKMIELRILGFDESVSAAEVRTAVALEGPCPSDQVRMGSISFARRGLGFMWVRYLAEVGGAIAKVGHLKLGWTRAMVEVLKGAPLRCFKCLVQGHVQ
ncbi:PREDICTED: uncharacterized protein LOC108778274 [Cyphomyrmex costatus]|uniref:uncharacterized protein LOC108778274 n=1 Tax=Cyphomyrmex costatus TaxID=456900 RepID=UPI0008522212|nr:PREDICTED: uncharacterized protein LOC108778274 [Cyphomyrmex costatus]